MKSSRFFAISLMAAACGGAPDSETDLQVGSTARPSFFEFESGVYQEPWFDGVYIVDGDVPVANLKQLRELYAQSFSDGALIVDRSSGADSKWSTARRRDLRYCISDSFGSRKASVMAAMREATADWAAAGDVRFVHVSSEDARCTPSNGQVVFDVRPVTGQPYVARAFFPHNERRRRNVLVNSTAFRGQSFLTGVLRHELGHVLGLRHEHTRPEAGGSCFEDNRWRALTDYDRASVMHYPHCGGTNQTLVMSLRDVEGIRALYGAPAGGASPPVLPGVDQSGTASDQVAKDEAKVYGPFRVVAASRFVAKLSGTGDADLYVRFGAQPTTSEYVCRPYTSGSAEECDLDVPSDTEAWVMVRGYSASSFDLEVAWRGPEAPSTPPPSEPPPAEPPPAEPPPPPAPEPVTGTATGALTAGQRATFNPIAVRPGTTFRAAMTGTGDADLYLRWDAAPSTDAYHCRPYLESSNETCELEVPPDASAAHLMIHGYTPSEYSLSVSWFEP